MRKKVIGFLLVFILVLSSLVFVIAQVPNPGHSWDQMVKDLNLTVDTFANRVGIGTTKPETKLHVTGGPARFEHNANSVQLVGVNHVYQEFYPQGVNGTRFAWFGFGENGTEILSIVNQRPSRLDLGTNYTTRLSISGEGRVGIGTTGPDRSLTIANTAGANYMNVKDGTREILMGVDSNGGIVSVMSGHDLILRSGGNVEKMRITAGGNVGIGTTGPTRRLAIVDAGVGFDRPALNNLAIYTGDTERVRIDSSGNVGIGTTGPTRRLAIVDAGVGFDRPALNNLAIYTGDTERVRITNTGNVGIGTTGPTRRLAIVDAGVGFDRPALNNLAIYTGDTERVRITNTGNVGIGTTGPTRRLAIVDAGVGFDRPALNNLAIYTGDTERVRITNTGNVGIGTTGPTRRLAIVDAGVGFDRPALNNLAIYTGDTERVRITNTGNVGIGTTGPTRRLAIVDAGVGFDRPALNNLAIYTGDTERVRITNTGNVGIGTTGPTRRLAIVDAGVGFDRPALNNLAIYTGDTERVRITNTGNVGIGTTNPQEKLDVKGHILASGDISANSLFIALDVYAGGIVTGSEIKAKSGRFISGQRFGYYLALQEDRNMVLYDNNNPIWATGTQESDIRLKKDIVPITGALESIKHLPAISFRWKDEERGVEREIGTIAQEVEKVYPSLVYKAPDGKGMLVHYDKLSVVLLAAIKEQQKEIEALKYEIQKLKNKTKEN